ncbi:MAG: response regulator [Deltaproteobacteria bacterium]|nr:response regulator [Deltaproteobacteria bacterium]
MSSASWQRAIVLTPYPEAIERLTVITDALRNAGKEVVICDGLQAATDALFKDDTPASVFLDAMSGASETALTKTVESLKDKAPFLAVVVIGKSPTAALVQGALRAGVFDMLDIARENNQDIAACFARIDEYRQTIDAVQEQKAVNSIIHRFMRSLVKVEKQRMDLENELQRTIDERRTEMASVLDVKREPVVLVIDDETTLLEYLQKKLGARGLKIHGFKNCQSASDAVAKMAGSGLAMDAALVDINLPDGSGIDLAAEMRGYAPHLAIFMMSGATTEELRARATDIRIAGFIKKPIRNLDSLVILLQEHAFSSMEQARESHYLQQIKRKHADLFDQLIGITQRR